MARETRATVAIKLYFLIISCKFEIERIAMNTAELKLDLINKIAQLKESHIIEEISNLLDFELSENIYKTSDKQINRIMEARAEYETGNTLTESSANAEIEEWIKK